MNNATSILVEFKNQMVNFFDELVAQFPREPDLVTCRIFLKDQIPIRDVMNMFIKNVLPHSDKIKRQDENFFLEENYLFRAFEKGAVVHFKTLWKSPALDSSDRKEIWKWMNSFVFLAKKYQKAMESE